MGLDPKRRDQQPVPDYIPDEFLRVHQSGARLVVRFGGNKPQSTELTRRQRFSDATKKLKNAAGQWLLLRTVLVVLVAVLSPTIWLLTDPASEGLLVVLSLLCTVAVFEVCRQVTLWLHNHRSGLAWLVTEAGTRHPSEGDDIA